MGYITSDQDPPIAMHADPGAQALERRALSAWHGVMATKLRPLGTAVQF